MAEHESQARARREHWVSPDRIQLHGYRRHSFQPDRSFRIHSCDRAGECGGHDPNHQVTRYPTAGRVRPEAEGLRATDHSWRFGNLTRCASQNFHNVYEELILVKKTIREQIRSEENKSKLKIIMS